MTKKRSTSKLLISGLIIVLTILLILGIFLVFSKNNKENQMARSSLENAKNSCFNCNKEVSYKSKFCSECGQCLKQTIEHEYNVQVQRPKLSYTGFHLIKIQKTSSGKYFVN